MKNHILSISAAIMIASFTSSALCMHHDPTIKYIQEDRNDYFCILAEKDDITIGFIKFEDNHIMQLDVIDGHKGNGVGATPFLAALQHIKAQGHSKAEWFASRSMPYYQQFGAHTITAWKQKGCKYPSALMEFDFSRDGNPHHNFKKTRSLKKVTTAQ